MDDQKGLTLVETLAVIVITSIVSILLISIISNSSDIHSDIIEDTKKTYDKSYVLKLVTKDIRMVNDPANIACIDGKVTSIKHTDSSVPIVYSFSNGQLKKDSQIIAENLTNFDMACTANKITITIEDITAKGATEELTSEIYLRRGS